MPAYVLVDIDITDPVRYETYKQLAPRSVAAYGGEYLVRAGAVKTLEGTWFPKRFVMLQFASVEDAERWWNSEEYREAKLLRQQTARTEMIVVSGS